MDIRQSILTLTEGGWSQRRIARELGINRETVAKYRREARNLSEAKPAILSTGSADSCASKPAILPTGSSSTDLAQVEGGTKPKPAIVPAVGVPGSVPHNRTFCFGEDHATL